MILRTFIKLLKSNLGCLQLIRYLKFDNHLFECRLCGGENEKSQTDPSLTQCAHCNYSEALTANTIFARHRKPLPDLMRIVLSVVIGEGKSGLEVSRKLNICQNTVWHWQRKARWVFASFFSPENTQSIHFTEMVEVLCRRTIESEPKPAIESTETDSQSVIAEEPADVDIIQSINGEECLPDAKPFAEPSLEQAGANEIIPEAEDGKSVIAMKAYLVKTYRCGVGHRHADGYTAQFYFITHFKGQILEFLTACMRLGAPPPAGSGPEYLTLPVLPRSSTCLV
jgi:hypothetical protein